MIGVLLKFNTRLAKTNKVFRILAKQNKLIKIMEKFGVKETSEMLAFLCRLTSAADAALADGEVTFMDSLLILTPLKSAGNAIKDAKLIPAEAGDLSETELLELELVIENELNVRSEFAKEVSGDFLEVAGKLAIIFRKFKALKEEGEVPTLGVDA